MSERVRGRSAESYDDFFKDDRVPKWWKRAVVDGEGSKTMWMIKFPGPIDLLGHGRLSDAHEVDEHEDGTISVVPKPGNSNSILHTIPGREIQWHGYIDHGVFYEA